MNGEQTKYDVIVIGGGARKVPYSKLTAREIERTYHFTDLPPAYTGLFQPDGASIDLRAAIRTLHDWNLASPFVTMLDEAPVTRIAPCKKSFEVTAPQGTFTAEKLVITPGPYANGVFHLLGFHIAATYWNMASAYYKITKPATQYPTWFVFQKPQGANGNEFYGFPEVSWDHPGYVRVASDFVIQPLASPEQRTFVPNGDELAFTAAWVREHMTGLEPVPEFTSTGWAGKFVPLLGRILSDLALDGRTSFDISHFRTGTTYFSRIDSAR